MRKQVLCQPCAHEESGKECSCNFAPDVVDTLTPLRKIRNGTLCALLIM